MYKKLDIAIEALERIKNEEGRVCTLNKWCTHISCQSSLMSWVIADKALDDIKKVKEKKYA